MTLVNSERVEQEKAEIFEIFKYLGAVFHIKGRALQVGDYLPPA